MKASSILNWKTALILAAVPFVAAWLQSVPSSASGGDMTSSSTAPDAAAVASADNPSPAPSADATQPTQAIAPATMPADLKLYGGTQEVVKMAQAGVSDDIIMAYITNSSARFGVTSDQIIYLNDLGVSSKIVTAMMQHDSAANAAAASTAPPNTPPPTVAALTPATAPGMDYANPPPQMDDTGAANPPPDNMDYSGPYPGDSTDDSTTADDTGYFYNSLQPYGSWIYVVGYGLCWQPTVCLRDHGWCPYFDRGRWLYSDCGWYWQSDYSWGWAAFHYGRWFRDDQRGWVWRPNRVWGPAWVAWRQNQDYCGWAPLPPSAVFVPGSGFRYHKQTVGANFGFGLSASAFTFIPVERMGDYAPSRYVVAPWQTGSIFSESRALTGVTSKNQQVANLGLDPRVVDVRAGVRVRRAMIQEIPGTDSNGRVQPDRLGIRGGSLMIYRPQLPSAPAGHAAGEAVNTRAATVLGTGGFPAGQPAVGADTAAHVRVYYVAHEEPKPAGTVSWYTPGAGRPAATGTYPPNSMVLVGQRNLSNPEWNSQSSQPSSSSQSSYAYRPSSTASYEVTHGTPVQEESQTARSSRVMGAETSAGYPQNYGNSYYRAPVVAAATPGSRATYSAPGYEYRPPSYNPAPEPSYRPAPEPQQNYSQPRENYSAPQPRENYSQPRESYSAPQQNNSQPAQSSSSSSSSSSGSSSRR